MTDTIKISREDVIHQLKLSCQVPSILEGILTRNFIAKEAEIRGIKISAEELQKAADNFRHFSNLRNASSTWLWLNKNSLSLDDFEELIQFTVQSSKLAQSLFADKVEPYFLEHHLDYTRASMFELVLDDADIAVELYLAFQEGEITFYEAVNQYSGDPDLRRSGGYRGHVSRSSLKPEISSAVFAATPPQVLKPIVTSKGVHLILIEEFIQPQLDDRLYQEILTNLFSNWMRKKIQTVKVEIEL